MDGRCSDQRLLDQFIFNALFLTVNHTFKTVHYIPVLQRVSGQGKLINAIWSMYHCLKKYAEIVPKLSHFLIFVNQHYL